LSALKPAVRQFAVDLLAPLVEQGSCDICMDVGSYLPVQVFGAWMNMSDEWLPELHDAGRAFNIAVQSAVELTMKETSLVLYDLARRLIALRKANPGDPSLDLTTALLETREEGEPLPEEMIVGMVRQVLVVGMIAPMVMLGSITVHLCRDRELQAKLRAEPELIPDAVEEFLRLYTPYRGFARTAVRDVEIGGRLIRAGEPIALVYASANRDESVFPNGCEFQLNRPNISEHLAFGRGPHNCPGAALGRLQLCVVLEELLVGSKGFALAGEIKPTRCPEIGALSVPIRFE
jgi:cytochrome P450